MKVSFGSYSRGKKVFVGLLVTTLVQGVEAARSPLEKARDLLDAKDFKQAHKTLNAIPVEEQDPKRMALVQTFHGLIFFEQNKYAEAIESFEKGLLLGTRLADVSHFYLGLSFAALNENEKALASFHKVDDGETSDYLRGQASYEASKMLMKLKRWGHAEKSLLRVRRKIRGSEAYPELLSLLVKAQLEQNKPSQACTWARDLYKNYPNHDSVRSWGLTWAENKFEGKSLKCADDLGDQQARIKRLQWLGESAKAYSELQDFEKSSVDQFTKDMALAEYLVNEGQVKEAYQKLKPYYKQKKYRDDFEYIGLLTKAGSRAGEYQASVGILMEAYKTLKGSDQMSALYRAAFMSYQHKDYDGALRRFDDLLKKYPYSRLAKEANWYIPWIYYLKGNYQKSYDLFTIASKQRSRKMPRSVSSTKLKYWTAMSLKRMGKEEEAQSLFLEVAHDQSMGYYSIAAIQRLRGMVGQRGLANVKYTQASGLTENWLPHLSAEEDAELQLEEGQTPVPKTKENYFADWEKLPFMREYLELGRPSELYSRVTTPEFRSRIERSKDLAHLGLYNLAKWELYTVEGRTKNQEHLKTLMFEYHHNQIYHRAVYIGTTHFAGTRNMLGLHLGASLWHFVLPRAFEKDVLQSSQSYGVPAEFVWSIMKAETNFRPDAVSPVGAKGLMQVMTHTGRKVASLMGKSIEAEDLFKPEVAVDIGASYLKRNLKRFKNKIPLAAAAYNGGPHRVQTWLHYFGDLDMDEFIEHIPFLETRNYVKKVTRYYTLYHLLYNKNVNASHWLSQSVDVHIDGELPTKETWEIL